MLELPEGDVIYTTDRKVPGTGIQLEFTLQFRDGRFVATLNAIRGQVQVPYRKEFPHLRKDQIVAWLVGLNADINSSFGTAYGGILTNELGLVMNSEPPAVPPVAPPTTAVIAEAAPLPEPTPVPEHFMLDDCWSEEDPTKLRPRQDITTFVTITRLARNRFLAHVKAFIGPEPPVWDDKANAAAFQRHRVANDLEMITVWLCDFTTTQGLTSKFGLENSDAVSLSTHWYKVFAPAIQEAKKQLLPYWLLGRKPPQQLHIIGDEIVRLP